MNKNQICKKTPPLNIPKKIWTTTKYKVEYINSETYPEMAKKLEEKINDGWQVISLVIEIPSGWPLAFIVKENY